MAVLAANASAVSTAMARKTVPKLVTRDVSMDIAAKHRITNANATSVGLGLIVEPTAAVTIIPHACR